MTTPDDGTGPHSTGPHPAAPPPATSPQLRPQRRARAIAMTPAEVDAFLAEQHTCRVATVGVNGPHATPLWYVWDGRAL